MIRKTTQLVILLASLISIFFFLYSGDNAKAQPILSQLSEWKRDISDNYLVNHKNGNKNKQKGNDDAHALAIPPPSSPLTPPPTTPKEPELNPCTVINPMSNGFFDLRELSNTNQEDGVVPYWNARGWDYGMNFTLGICSTPLKKSHLNNNDFNDVSNTSLVGGYYTDHNNVKQSIGEFSTKPVFRGRKLTLTYEDGSFCKETPDGQQLRKSTILSFQCDRAIMQKAQVSFVGVLHDCDYFFEVRTVHACPTAAKEDNLALVWIFVLIFLAALFVFCGAGTLYRRFGRRGWKPLPSSSHGIMHQLKTIVTGPLALLGFKRRGYQNNSLNLDNMNTYRNGFLDILDEEEDEEET